MGASEGAHRGRRRARTPVDAPRARARARRHSARDRGGSGRHRLRSGRHRRRRKPPDLDRRLSGDGGDRPPPRSGPRTPQRGLPDHGRRAAGAGGGVGRRGDLPLRIHAHGRPLCGTRGDPPGAARGQAPGAGGVGRARGQPLDHDPRSDARRARSHPAAGPREPEPVQHGERGAHTRFDRGCGLRHGAHARDSHALRVPRHRRLHDVRERYGGSHRARPPRAPEGRDRGRQGPARGGLRSVRRRGRLRASRARSRSRWRAETAAGPPGRGRLGPTASGPLRSQA